MTTPFAHLVRCSLIAAITAPLTGCLTYHALTDDPPPDFSVIEIGATREIVERELGKPERKNHNIYTYEYNARVPSNLNISKSQLLFWMAFVDVGTMGLSAAYGPGISRAKKANRAEVAIVYAPNGKVLNLFRTGGPGRSQPDDTSLFHEWLQSPASLDDQRLCIAANHGYAPAQFTQAMRYRYGIGTEPDDVKAYLWARLAAFGGHPSAEETARGWGHKMNAKDVEEGEALFKEFGPADCPSV